ncbi:putative mobilization protein [Pseudomonas syringae pv. broussonetiae]|uniref:Uncharacterized protein n=1 Tax=Pseudomonas savastanoi TaxID=29438 RepID=A0A3M5JUS2_PSESS|nr:putative mobilization protein [Pseudomonas syringae pv. broussonetiae]KUR46636.1 hypothetical protein PSTA9_02040 [Pseudomonas syringae pv. tomato]RMT26854.1 hypothetical protein ALP51_200145 [Pseudomonas savastanoi]
MDISDLLLEHRTSSLPIQHFALHQVVTFSKLLGL